VEILRKYARHTSGRGEQVRLLGKNIAAVADMPELFEVQV
jgi:hypothetical protein